MSTEAKSQSLTPQELDFHHAHILARYVTETGKILPSKINRISSKQQRKVKRSIKRARNLRLMQ